MCRYLLIYHFYFFCCFLCCCFAFLHYVRSPRTFLLFFFFDLFGAHRDLHVLTHSFPPRRSSDLAQLPVDTVMCTVGLARRLNLGTENLRLETLARHWGATQLRPHDALDDALVLAQILKPALVQARERRSWLPIRSDRKSTRLNSSH